MWLYDRLASRGFKVFLDRKDAGVLHDLPALVARSKCFIFVLSSGIFGSRWCLLELAAAVQAEVRAVFIFRWSLSAKLQMTNFVQCFVVVVVGAGVGRCRWYHSSSTVPLGAQIGPRFLTRVHLTYRNT